MTKPSSSSRARIPEVQSLIDRFQLAPHPEGGFFREVFRSSLLVRRLTTSAPKPLTEDQDVRSALTDIYFLLEKDDYSCFHRVNSDEAWHHLSGGPLQLVLISPDLKQRITHIIEPAATGEEICVVPSNWWQAAVPLSSHALCSCSVGPGFDFSDFDMAKDVPAGDQLRQIYPDLDRLV